jgi:predicted nucleic acid-binding Zn ribbon protein
MARKDPPIERLGEVLETSLKRLDLNARLDDYGVWTIWNQTVGAAIARNAQPEKIRNGTLMVKVSSPVWMQQLQFMKDLLAEKINERLRANVVKSIFFVVGTLAKTDAEPEEEPVSAKTPADNDGKIDEPFLESIQDPEIRQAFKKLLRGYARRKK